MAKALTQRIQNMLSDADVKMRYVFTIDSVDYSSYLQTWSIDSSKEFGAMSATFTLYDNDGIFNDGGSNKINVGDVVSFSEYFSGDVTEFKKFYGKVQSRSINKSGDTRSITLVCLDFISTLQFLDIDLEVEGTKIEVTNEILKPNYLDSPNDNLSQLFDFANDALADNPLPIILIKNKNTDEEDPQFDGYEVYYDAGQLKLGFPLNARYNYDLIATSYYFYTHGVYIEDILEDILTLTDGYGSYLFDEYNSTNVINNHLTETFSNVQGVSVDYLTPNYTASTITIETTLTYEVGAGSTSITVASTEGFPISGQGSINGDIFTWTGKTDTTLTGIPLTGVYALDNHKANSYVEYEHIYDAGQVWYLSYSNLVSDLTAGNFTIPNGGLFSYLDKRYGRIILNGPISTSSTVSCNINYTFKTLQATGVSINKISFRSREVENRFEAIKKLFEYLAPNYIIHTVGDNKIWARYLSQKLTEDYTLELVTQVNYMEDEDLYTRCLFYAKNKAPTNLMFDEGVDFATTGQDYKALASNTQLSLIRDEDNYYVYGMSISGVGKIFSNTIKPIVYVNNVPIDNTTHLIVGQQVSVETTTKTESNVEWGWK